ncbi:uncharacterized protein EI90DRAFT_3011179 [Cantharellus anzutake]|uniref:uncharacterized protein n=1 Tax=Cantharellus anzutake TaxID=1750568 RepID=UPI001907C42E|nr:uncharacterized protein EI90DRAFT_3011179 [Cantharellus anzutake]KAF8342670.1 hypothetical protein EI90DRAFT_3011179 [Cantharellus anzutake]
MARRTALASSIVKCVTTVVRTDGGGEQPTMVAVRGTATVANAHCNILIAHHMHRSLLITRRSSGSLGVLQFPDGYRQLASERRLYTHARQAKRVPVAYDRFNEFALIVGAQLNPSLAPGLNNSCAGQGVSSTAKIKLAKPTNRGSIVDQLTKLSKTAMLLSNYVCDPRNHIADTASTTAHIILDIVHMRLWMIIRSSDPPPKNRHWDSKLKGAK